MAPERGGLITPADGIAEFSSRAAEDRATDTRSVGEARLCGCVVCRALTRMGHQEASHRIEMWGSVWLCARNMPCQ